MADECGAGLPHAPGAGARTSHFIGGRRIPALPYECARQTVPLALQKWDAHGHGIRELAPAASAAGVCSLSFLYNWEASAAAQGGGPQVRQGMLSARQGRKNREAEEFAVSVCAQIALSGRRAVQLCEKLTPASYLCRPAAPAAHQACRVWRGGGGGACRLGRGGKCRTASGLVPPLLHLHGLGLAGLHACASSRQAAVCCCRAAHLQCATQCCSLPNPSVPLLPCACHAPPARCCCPPCPPTALPPPQRCSCLPHLAGAGGT